MSVDLWERIFSQAFLWLSPIWFQKEGISQAREISVSSIPPIWPFQLRINNNGSRNPTHPCDFQRSSKQSYLPKHKLKAQVKCPVPFHNVGGGILNRGKKFTHQYCWRGIKPWYFYKYCIIFVKINSCLIMCKDGFFIIWWRWRHICHLWPFKIQEKI